jgi:cytochrome c oxidase subunit II
MHRDGLARFPAGTARVRTAERPAAVTLRIAVPAGFIAAMTGCDPIHSILVPAGPYAERITFLWWLMFSLGTAVFLAVLALLGYAHHPGRRRGPDGSVPMGDLRFIVVAGAIVPALVVFVVMIPTFRIGAELARIPDGAHPLIEIVGHQFWWEVRYPEYGVVTANEIHIPAGRPVELRLLTRDVIHSFWIPELAGKLDMIPGRENRTWLQADEPGVYRGPCAEYCGIQHTRMEVLVIAQPEADFSEWLAHQAREAIEPTTDVERLGQEVYFQADCHLCHAIRGVAEPTQAGSPGPDLTHLASRLTLGSAIMENNRGNLGGWILDPQQAKPGNRMPPTFLDPASLHALIAYLESLR